MFKFRALLSIVVYMLYCVVLLGCIDNDNGRLQGEGRRQGWHNGHGRQNGGRRRQRRVAGNGRDGFETVGKTAGVSEKSMAVGNCDSMVGNAMAPAKR